MTVLFLQRKDLGDFRALVRDDFLELVHGRRQPSADWRRTQKTIDAFSQLVAARSRRRTQPGHASRVAAMVRPSPFLFPQKVVRHEYDQRPARRMKD